MLALSVIAQTAPQPVECTNCSNASGTIGILLAGLAIVLSLWSLYITALRRPAIHVEHVPRARELVFNAFDGLPRQAELSLWIVVANTGASVTFVDKLGLVPGIRFHGAQRSPFGPMQVAQPSLLVKGVGIGTLPAVLERGDGESYRLGAAFERATGIEAPEEFAEILRELTERHVHDRVGLSTFEAAAPERPRDRAQVARRDARPG